MALTNEELANIMADVNYELEKFGRMTEATADRLRDAKVGVEGFSAAVRQAPQQIGKAARDMAGAMYRGEQGAKAFNSSIDNMADAASSAATVLSAMIPGGPAVRMLIGGITKLAKVTIKAGAELQKAAGAQGDALFNTYRQLAQVGAAGGDGLSGLAEDARIAGKNILDMGNYASLIAESAPDLALYAGTVSEGRKRFAEINGVMMRSGEMLERLGYNSDAQSDAAMRFVRIQTRMGLAQTQSTEQLGQAAVRAVVEFDRMAKITGLTAAQQEKSLNDAYRNQRFAAAMDILRDQGNTKVMRQMTIFNLALEKIGPVTQKGFQDMAAGMGMSDDAAKANLATGHELMQAVQRIRSDAVKDDVELAALLEQVRLGMIQFKKTMGNTMAGVGMADEIMGSFAEARNAELAGTNGFTKILREATQEADKQTTAQDKLLGTLANTAQKQRQIMVNEQELMQQAVPLATKNINALATAAEAASDALVKIAGGQGGRTGAAPSGTTSAPNITTPGSGPNQGLGMGGARTGAAGGPMPGMSQPTEAQMASLAKIRDLIGRVESDSSGGYNATAGERSPVAELTRMTIDQVRDFQRQRLRAGKYAAVGRYQFIPQTFDSVVAKLGIRGDEIFSEALQDRMADYLIRVSGYDAYARGNQNAESKARLLQALSGVWMGLPNQPGTQAGTARGRDKVGISWDDAIPYLAKGGVVNMPQSGGLANLHGTEAVVPLPDGRSIPVVVKTDFSDLRNNSGDVNVLATKLSSEISVAVQNAANSLLNSVQLQPILAALQDISRHQREVVALNEKMLRNSVG